MTETIELEDAARCAECRWRGMFHGVPFCEKTAALTAEAITLPRCLARNTAGDCADFWDTRPQPVRAPA